MKINKFNHAKDCSIIDTIDVEDYISYIKDGFNHQDVLDARTYGKGTTQYKKIKEKRNAVTFNFLFDKKYKINDNIIKSTGMLFFDIDDVEFDITKLDLDKIFLLHKSFGGNGWSIIVKVDADSISHIDHNAFKQCYYSIAEQIGIVDVMDINAIKMTQFTLLSYDPNIIVNYNSTTLKSNVDLTTIQKRDTTPIKARKEKKERICSSVPFLKKNDKFIKLKFETKLDKYDEDCVYISDGKEFVECKSPFDSTGKPRKVNNGEKHKWLSLYINNLIYLNPTANRKQLYVTLNSFAKSHCNENVSEANLLSIIDYKLKQEAECLLKPFGERLKKFWVNPLCKDKKLAYQTKRRSMGVDAIDAFFGDDILNMNCKITYKVIAETIGVSEKTIKRRITDEQKQIIKEVNKNLKQI